MIAIVSQFPLWPLEFCFILCGNLPRGFLPAGLRSQASCGRAASAPARSPFLGPCRPSEGQVPGLPRRDRAADGPRVSERAAELDKKAGRQQEQEQETSRPVLFFFLETSLARREPDVSNLRT